MAIDENRWGTDLRLLDNLTSQNDRSRGSDLFTARRAETGLQDLESIHGLENLSQALLLRFLTPLGEMAILGHPEYGSRLFELIGEPNTETNRNRAKMYVLQALQAEPRVKKVVSVTVTSDRRQPNRIDINVHLNPVDSNTPLNLVFPFFLEGEAIT